MNSIFNLGQKVLTILQFLTHRMPIHQIWYPYNLSPCPTLVNVVLSRTEMIQPDFSIFVLRRNGGLLILSVVVGA